MLQSFVAMAVITLGSLSGQPWFGESVHGLIGPPAPSSFSSAGRRRTDSRPLFAGLFALLSGSSRSSLRLITGRSRKRMVQHYLLSCAVQHLHLPPPPLQWHPDGLGTSLVCWTSRAHGLHMTAGLAACRCDGPRPPAAHVSGEAHTPANIPFVILGTGMLWFGWFGFNAGSALSASGQAAMAFATTNTASASAALAWIFFDGMRGNKPSALGACVGAVVGLVAITPAAGFVSIGESIFIGTVASVVSNLMVHWKNSSTVDDTLDVFPCHGEAGGRHADDRLFARTSAQRCIVYVLVHCGALLFLPPLRCRIMDRQSHRPDHPAARVGPSRKTGLI